MKEEGLSALSMADAVALARDFNTELTVPDYIGMRASVSVALAMTELFWPRLIEARGCVLLAWAYDPGNLDRWWDELKGNVPAIESVLNHMHLWDVFHDVDEEDAPALEVIGQRLVQTWQQHASKCFPEREFESEFFNNENDYGPTLVLRSKV